MQQMKSVKTLFQLCVDNVIKEVVCGSGQKIMKHSNQEISFNPFDELPTSVLEEVICALERKLRKKFVRCNVTLQPGRPTQDLSIECWDLKQREPVRRIVLEHLMHAFFKCPWLKIFKLPYHTVTSNETLVGLFPRYNNLQELNISRAGRGAAGDNCLWILGTHCKHLRYLNVNDCTEVTDFGIQGLCLDYIERENDEDEQQTRKRRKTNDSEMRERYTPRLSNSLQTLCLKRTKVTEKGIQEALQKLRSLRILKHASTVKVLGEMHETDWGNSEMRKTIPKYALSKIKIYDNDNQTSRKCLLKAGFLCPSVTTLNIGLTGRNFHQNKMYTDGYFDSICNVIGNQLQKLSLKLFNSSKIRTIIDCCPNLRILQLSFDDAPLIDDERPEFFNIKKSKTLKELEELELLGNISSENLLTLLSSSSLKSINIENCDTLTDDMLQKASDLHLFSNLERLVVWMCDFVTEKGINVLLKETNTLKKITIYFNFCKCLTKEEREDMKLQCALKNWQLDIEFYEHTPLTFSNGYREFVMLMLH